MAEAAAAFVVKMLALKGTEAAVVAAVVEVAVNVAAYAAVSAITRQNGEQKQQGGLIDLQLNSAAPRQLVIGKRMTGGVLIDWYLAGSNNTKLYMPVYLSEGPCGQVTRVFADGREVWNTPLVHGVRTTIPDFRSGGDRLWLTYYDGRVGQTADATLVALSQGWTSANTMTGCAYVVVECQWDSDNMRSPPSLSFEMEGAKLYDRRLDTTAGGSGSHRIDNPATWAFSDNPMVALDHFLLGRYWDGARTFGIGLSADEVPYSYFAAQANICDEDVDLKAGGTQKRYRANGFIAANEDYASTITKLCTAMAARPADFGGRFGVIGVESKTPVLTIDDGDLIAGVQEVYTPKRSWSELVGEVEGRFQDPAQLYQPTPYPNITDATWEAEDGGEPKLMTFDLEFETHVERAQRLATLKARAERRQATLSGVYPLWTVELERGDWFIRTGAKWGEDGKTFEVVERVLNTETYTVTIVSQEVDATDSAWDESVAADGPPTPLAATDELSAVTAPSLTVTSNPIVGAASNTPALKIAFTNPTDPRVHTMFVEVYRASDDLKVATVPVTIPDADEEVIIQNGIADGVLYDVRAKYLTPGLSSAWSTTVSATTGSTYAVGTVAYATEAGSAAVGSALEADIAAAGASADADAAAAAASAAAAAASQTAASGSATAASGSATAANSSQTAAAGSASAAASSASAAAASASAAAGSASAASTSASAASTSASNAATSASAASTSATNAATQASNAATSASQASTSETNAAGSEATASTAATNAAASQSAAAGSATAASGSASTASTQAGNAATSASAALTSETAAAASASSASSSASTATTQASNASASAASASSSATLSATFAAGSQGSINSSATFADNTNATGLPTNWGNWSYGSTAVRVAGIAPQPYALQLAGGAGLDVGISQYVPGGLTKGFYVLEADVTLNSGALTGAGVWFDWLVATVGTGASVVFATDPDITGSVVGAGTTGRLYRFRKLVEVASHPDNGHTSIYAMSHWAGHGSIASANDITWHRCALRAASQAEIEARQAKLDLVTTNANVATNTSAIATEASSRASADSTLTARFVSNSAASQNYLRNSTFRDGLTNWVTGGSPSTASYIDHTYVYYPYGAYRYAYQDVRCEPGGVYSVIGEIYKDNTNNARLLVQWLNDARDTSLGYPVTINASASGWTTATQDGFTAPTNAVWARLITDNYDNGLGYGSTGGSAARRICFTRSAYAQPWAETDGLVLGIENRAGIATNASAISTANSSISSLTTTVSANQVTATTIRKNLLTNSTGIRGLTDWTNPGAWSTYEHPLWGHWFDRTFTGLSLTSEQFYSAEMAANPGEQYSISFVPYLAGLTSGTVRVSLNFYNSGHVYIGESAGVTLTSGMTRVRQKEEAIAAPTGTAYMRFVLSMYGPAVGDGSYAEVGFWQAKVECGATATAWRADAELNNGLTRLATAEAGVTTNASAIATETSARAAADTLISAEVRGAAGGAAINSSATFADNTVTSGTPTNWSNWSNGSGTRVTGISPQPYAFTLAGGAGVDGGISQSLTGKLGASNWYVLEADVTLNSGSFSGAGVYLDWNHASGYALVNIDFDTDVDASGAVIGAGTTGRLYRFRKLIQTASNLDPTQASNIYAMSHYSGLGSTASANSITWHRCAIRVASQAEIEARAATTALVTTNANVATNASAIATETSARAAADSTLTASIGTTNANVSTNASAIATINGAAAFWETIVSASGGDLAAVRLKAGASGSYLELISTVLRLANVSNGSVIEVMRAVSGEAYFSRPVSSDGGGKRVTIGPGYGVSGSEVVLWFGADSVAPSAQSRTNGYFALGTDGKVYYGSAELSSGGITATASPSSSTVSHSYTSAFSTGSISITASGGSGYTYAWEVVKTSGTGAAPTMSSYTASSSTASCTLAAGQDVQGFIKCTVSATGGKSTVVVIPFSFNETS